MGAPEKQIIIPEGWNTRRFQFMLEIEYNYATGGKITEVIMGYTSHRGISLQGTKDPNMEFFVNSVMQTRETVQRTPMGGNEVYRSVIDTSHVLADNNWSGLYSPAKDVRMRPEDVYATMSRGHLPDLGSTVDMRTALTGVAVKSRRSNGLASSYMAGILENLYNAQKTDQGGEGYQEMFGRARGYAAEPSAVKDPFLNAVTQFSSRPIGNSFTLRELNQIDPGCEQRIETILLGPVDLAKEIPAHLTSQWEEIGIHSQLASMLGNSVPALMLDNGITRMHLQASNQSSGQFDRRLVPQCNVFDIDSFGSGDHSIIGNEFIRRFNHEVAADLSNDGNSEYMVEMEIDLLGETRIKISIDGQNADLYLMPSFADGLMVPVLTQNAQHSMKVANDFNMLFETVVPSFNPQPSGAPGSNAPMRI
jgi:hypothetical protein